MSLWERFRSYLRIAPAQVEPRPLRVELLDGPYLLYERQNYKDWSSGDVDALLDALTPQEKQRTLATILQTANPRDRGAEILVVVESNSIQHIKGGDVWNEIQVVEIHRFADGRFLWRKYEHARLD